MDFVISATYALPTALQKPLHRKRSSSPSSSPRHYDLIAIQSQNSAKSRSVLALRGLHAMQSALHKILMTPTLQSVHLEYVHVLEGSFWPLLDCLIAPGRRLDHFCLDDIFEGDSEMLYFCVEGAPKFRSMRKGPGPSTVRRSGREVATPLEHGHARGRILGSSRLVRYWE